MKFNTDLVVQEPKPKVILVGEDGNAFAVMGAVSEALKQAKHPTTYVSQVTKEMMSGDYDHLLATAMAVCEVE